MNKFHSLYVNMTDYHLILTLKFKGMKKSIIWTALYSVTLTLSISSCTNEVDSPYQPEVEKPLDVLSETMSRTAGTIVFEDDFDQPGPIPDTTKWVLCPPQTSNWNRYMSESYDQAYVFDSKLILLAENVDGIYKTGGVQTLGKFEFQYGKVEVNARFTQTAQGGWAAIWMMPKASTPIYNGWPACGEIDIMEQLNHDGYVYQTIHSHYKNTLGITSPSPSTTATINVGEFNTYGLEWTEDSLIFSVNGNTTLTYPNLKLENEDTQKQWPFCSPYYLILNQALGGNGTWPGPITDSQLPAKMEVDWVRVTQY